jgi:anti-sigma regulatory factor (Ser/Thr protein kinase)
VIKTDSSTVDRSYPARPASVPEARKASVQLAAAAGASREPLEAVALAVSEAMTNAVVHAYRGEPGQIHLTATVASGELFVLVADDGCGLRAREDSPGLGHGLRLIALVSDGLEIAKRSTGGTELRMRFELGADQRRCPRLAG